MFVPATFAVAILMTILSTICWGSFANTYKLTKNYRFELYYWDYAFGIVAIALVLAFTMGSSGGGPNSFMANVTAAAGLNIFWPILGGVLFNVANVLLIAGLELVGLAIAFPISIGIALVEGVVLSYALQPKGNIVLLGSGVATAVLAVILIGKAYGARNEGAQAVSRKGVIVCVISGLLMGTFAPFITRAMTADRPLTPYSAAVFFTVGALLCCFVFNVILMRKPIVGEPVGFGAYFAAPGSYHVLGIIGGAIWGVGTVFNFVAANFVGVAISYAIGQASPMIAALWGVFVWHEFRGANAKAKGYLVGMFVCYVLALFLIARAYNSA